jgi:hypothetical protein
MFSRLGHVKHKWLAVVHARSLTRLNNAEFRDDAFHKTEVGVILNNAEFRDDGIP